MTETDKTPKTENGNEDTNKESPKEESSKTESNEKKEEEPPQNEKSVDIKEEKEENGVTEIDKKEDSDKEDTPMEDVVDDTKKEAEKHSEDKPAEEEESKSDKADSEKNTIPSEPVSEPKRVRKAKANQLEDLLSSATPSVPKPSDTASPFSSKRTRKSIERLTPADDAITPKTKSFSVKKGGLEGLEVEVIAGRGTALGEIPGVEDAMDVYAKKSVPLMTIAHRFLFGGRGKMIVVTGPKKQAVLKENMLKFSGYLSKEDLQGDEDSVGLTKQDEDAEKKMTARATKLFKADIVELCNFFNVDRSPREGQAPLDKEGVMNRLLDFLGNPDLKMTKQSRKKVVAKKTPTKKATKAKGKKRPHKSDESEEEEVEKKKSKTVTKTKTKQKKGSLKKKSKKEAQVIEAEVVESEDDEMTVPDSGSEDDDYSSNHSQSPDSHNGKPKKRKSEGSSVEMPSEKALKKWVKAYVACFNLNKATTNHALKTAGEKFGVDLTPRKSVLKTLLTKEIYEHMQIG